MCFDLADPRGSGGGAGWPVKWQGEGGAAAASAAMAAGIMSDYYQEQELSTMVSALTHVVAGGAAPWGSGREEQAMYGGGEMGRYPGGATSPEFAGNQLPPSFAPCSLLPWFCCLLPSFSMLLCFAVAEPKFCLIVSAVVFVSVHDVAGICNLF